MKCIICEKEFEPIHGMQICCTKECSKERRKQKKREYANTTKYKEWSSEYQKEYRERALKTITEHKEEYCIKMKDLLNEKRRLYYIKNRDRLLKESKKYYASHKEQKALYDKEYRIKNAEKLKKYFREYAMNSDRPKMYRIENAERIRINNHIKRIRKYNYKNYKIDKNITKEFLYKKYNGMCCICGEKCDSEDYYYNKDGYFITGKKYPTIDHIIPISKGGEHTEENTQLAHFVCNCKKNNKA